MLQLVLQKLICLNNESIRQVQPDDVESQRTSLCLLQQALCVLRNEACTDSDTSSEVASSTDEYQLHLNMKPTVKLFTHELPCHFEASSTFTSEPFYFYDSPFLLQTSSKSENCNLQLVCEEKAIRLVSATLLFNFSLVCHRYGMSQAKVSSTSSLLTAMKLYKVLIGLLSGIISTTDVEMEQNDEHPSHDDEHYFVLLLSIAYNNLSLCYFDLQMYAECDMYMKKLNEWLVSHSFIFEGLWVSDYNKVVHEITMNVNYWKLSTPSAVAVAA